MMCSLILRLSLQLPESTHTLFFTQPVGCVVCHERWNNCKSQYAHVNVRFDCRSIPFLFALGIAAISVTSLAMALFNNLEDNEIPANVTVPVRIAQYLAIFIALLMEEGELYFAVAIILCT